MKGPEQLFDSLEPFLETVGQLGIDSIVLRRTDEFRPIPGVAITPDFRYRRLELLAYRDPILYKCILEGKTTLDVGPDLARRGIQARLVSGNIT